MGSTFTSGPLNPFPAWPSTEYIKNESANAMPTTFHFTSMYKHKGSLLYSVLYVILEMADLFFILF